MLFRSGDNGAAVLGWQTIEDDDYYFDNSGIMATGEVQVGLVKCTFSKKGKLKSKGDVNIDASKPMVALTFDDGPGERTGELLAQLEKYNAHATFFMQGKNIPGKEDFVKKMKETGCELGNHSYDHPQLTKLSADKIANQIGTTNDLIQQAAGSTATVMRPPYGAINDTVRSSVGLPMILWSIDTLDWKTRNAQSSIDTVMNDVQDGDVILMHDIHTESIDAALVLIPKLEEAGYQLVTVSEMAKAKETARQIPLERILLETDCPYMAPTPFRGKRNNSAYIDYVAQEIADLKGISKEEVIAVTEENAKKLFAII